jgi:ornithine cyclodeaminase/alanine dehydrogenase-like protein (mu-crystallin family)
VELGAVLSAATPGRISEDGITLFKSVGVALEDLGVARFVLDALGVLPSDVGQSTWSTDQHSTIHAALRRG